MATVAPAADAATSALKVITEMVRTVRLILRIIEHAPAKRTVTNGMTASVIAGEPCLQLHLAQVYIG
jgi:hypothetical protein